MMYKYFIWPHVLKVALWKDHFHLTQTISTLNVSKPLEQKLGKTQIHLVHMTKSHFFHELFDYISYVLNYMHQVSTFNLQPLLEILSFATNHYATHMQLIIVCNYLDHICNYKFGIV
jgi:hypothetical protein